MKKVIFSVAGAIILLLVCNCLLMWRKPVRDGFSDKLVHDTIYKDTFYTEKTIPYPVPVKEYVTNTIPVPVYVDSGKVDTVPMQVVQRTYTDDSTYTAYVSGVLVDSLPRLDSITVKQRTITITHDVERIITKRKRLTYGIQVGTGYGLTTHRPDIYLGLGVQINFK